MWMQNPIMLLDTFLCPVCKDAHTLTDVHTCTLFKALAGLATGQLAFFRRMQRTNWFIYSFDTYRQILLNTTQPVDMGSNWLIFIFGWLKKWWPSKVCTCHYLGWHQQLTWLGKQKKRFPQVVAGFKLGSSHMGIDMLPLSEPPPPPMLAVFARL